MVGLVDSLLRRKNRVDSPENFQKQKSLLKESLRAHGLYIGFEGNYQIHPSRVGEPGPRFPFILGFDEEGIVQLKNNILDGISISPAFIEKREYSGEKAMRISGEIPGSFITFFEVLDRFSSLDEAITGIEKDKGPIEFAKKVNYLMGDKNQNRVETTRYIGLLSSDNQQNPLYEGQFMDYYSKLPNPVRKGIFQLERVI